MNLTSDGGSRSMYQQTEPCKPTPHFLEGKGKCKRSCVKWQVAETSGLWSEFHSTKELTIR